MRTMWRRKGVMVLRLRCLVVVRRRLSALAVPRLLCPWRVATEVSAACLRSLAAWTLLVQVAPEADVAASPLCLALALLPSRRRHSFSRCWKSRRLGLARAAYT